MIRFAVDITMPKVYSQDIYLDGKNCYLAQALKKKFPESEIRVWNNGNTQINNEWVSPLKETPFDANVVCDNLGNTLTIKFETGAK